MTDEERRELADKLADSATMVRKVLGVQASRALAAARAHADPDPEHQPPPAAPAVAGITFDHADAIMLAADIVRPESEATL